MPKETGHRTGSAGWLPSDRETDKFVRFEAERSADRTEISLSRCTSVRVASEVKKSCVASLCGLNLVFSGRLERFWVILMSLGASRAMGL